MSNGDTVSAHILYWKIRCILEANNAEWDVPSSDFTVNENVKFDLIYDRKKN